jgi:hypothetical protein
MKVYRMACNLKFILEPKTKSMKQKSLTLLTLMIAFTTLTLAQGKGSGSFHVGIKGGSNILKVDGKSFKEEFKFGYNLGAFAELYLNSKWGIQPEVLFNQTNIRTSNKFSEIYPDGFAEIKDVKLNYLSIPVLLNFRPSRILTFQAGPQFGILINKDQNLFQNGKEAFKSGDFSLLGGVQLNILGAKVGGRYVVGLSNINDIDNQDKWKNQGFQLYIGFKII